MKSAYELAMERLEKQAPSVKVTEQQKLEIAEIESAYKAKIAERELFLTDQIRKAVAAGQHEEVEKLNDQLTRDLRRLRDDCETKKERVRKAGVRPS
jgi:hypothetical protein